MAPWLRLTVWVTALSWSVLALPMAVRGEQSATPTPPSKILYVNPEPISVPAEGPADLYPSVIKTDPLFGVVGTIRVTLHGFTHGRPRDLDVLLVGPTGIKVLLQSDSGGDGALKAARYTFDQAAGAPIAEAVPPADRLGYRPADYGGPDAFPAPAPPGPYGTSLADFFGSPAAGPWSLYVVDDQAGSAGQIAAGWSLDILVAPLLSWGTETGVIVPDVGPASPYPLTVQVSGVRGTIANPEVDLLLVSHSRPDDLDVLVVGPTGIKVLLQSDAGGDGNLDEHSYVLSSLAADALPDESPLTLDRYRPANYGGGDVFPPPAPPGPYGSSLADFEGTDPNGTWQLYVVDDAPGDAGRIGEAHVMFSSTAVPEDFRKGDFNYDLEPDLVWRNDVSGETVFWGMAGGFAPEGFLTHGLTTNPPVLDPRWKIVGTHDFNADRRTDLLFRHSESGQVAVWFMNGAAIAGGTFTDPPAVADTRWVVAGTGDFDGDRRPDILWRNVVSGQNAVWFMNGTAMHSGTFTDPATMDPVWAVAGVADFNQDQHADILWHHPSTGELFIWLMSGAAHINTTVPTPSGVSDTDWKVAAVTDFGLGGWILVHWRHQHSGQIARWSMLGTSRQWETLLPEAVPDPTWRLAGPR